MFSPWSYAPLATMVNAPDGSQHKYSFDSISGILLPTELSAPCPECGNTAAQISYNPTGDRTKVVNHDGRVSFFTYDSAGRAIQETLASNAYASQSNAPVGLVDTQTTSTEWHPNFRLPTKITKIGRTIEYAYDTRGNLLSEKITDTTAAPNKVSTRKWTYTPLNQVATATDELNKTISYTYSASGSLTSVTDSLGRSTTFTHDGSGRVLTTTDPTGLVTLFSYDLRGNILSTSSTN